MSDDHKKVDDKDEIPEKESMRHHQSGWISHWTDNKRFKPVGVVDDDAQSHLSLNCGESGERISHHMPKLFHGSLSSEQPDEKETGNSSKFVKEFREMHKAIRIESPMATSLRKLRHEPSSTGQQFPMFKSYQNRDGILSLKSDKTSSSHQEGFLMSNVGPTTSCHDVSRGQIDKCLVSMQELAPSKRDNLSIKSQFEPQGILSDPNQQVKSKEYLEENRIVISEPPKNVFFGSTSRISPLQFNCGSGRTSTQSFFPRQDYIHQASLVHDERKINNNAALLINRPSTGDNHLRDFLGEQVREMSNHSDIELFPDNVRPQETRLYHESYELPRIASSIHDVETMRICTTIGSVEEFTLRPPKCSQTTHHFLITKKTDVNLFDGGEMFKESTISAKFKGKQPSGLLSLTPDFGFNVKQGVKLQPLDSSTDSEAKENMENIHTSAVDLKNESSAETDIMDMDTLRVNQLPGTSSSISNKVSQKSQTLEAAVASVMEKSRGGLPNTELPDINQEVPPIPHVTSSTDDGEASTSRTQSLDVEHFLPHAEHLKNSKSSARVDSSSGLDPYSRWVKRLKPSASNSYAHGTKSTKMGEASSHEKVNKFFGKMHNSGKEPKMNKSSGIQPMVADQTAVILKNVESSSIDSVRKNDVTLSHPWIRRWCHNQAASLKKNPEPVVVNEHQSSKANKDEFQKNQFPSIAAMALMGKAMNGFHPCEFRKRGCFIVWNTKGVK